MTVSFVRDQMTKIMSEIDEDSDFQVSKDEFMTILQSSVAVNCLQEAGVDPIGLLDYADFIFPEEECGDEEAKSLSMEDFVEVLLQFRGSEQATVKNMVDLRSFLDARVKKLLDRFENQPESRKPSKLRVQAVLVDQVGLDDEAISEEDC